MSAGTYYRDQLHKVVIDPEYGAKIKVTSEGTETKWLNLNKDSVNELRLWLNMHFGWKERKKEAPEAMFFKYGKAGEVYYSEKPDKDFSARASYFNRKVRTERLITIETDGEKETGRVVRLTKVTLL